MVTSLCRHKARILFCNGEVWDNVDLNRFAQKCKKLSLIFITSLHLFNDYDDNAMKVREEGDPSSLLYRGESIGTLSRVSHQGHSQ